MRRHAFDDPRRPGGLDIDLGRRRRIARRFGYWLVVALAAAAFVLLFERLTGSRPVALFSVLFMGAYMLGAAGLAAKSLRQPPASNGLG